MVQRVITCCGRTFTLRKLTIFSGWFQIIVHGVLGFITYLLVLIYFILTPGGRGLLKQWRLFGSYTYWVVLGFLIFYLFVCILSVFMGLLLLRGVQRQHLCFLRTWCGYAIVRAVVAIVTAFDFVTSVFYVISYLLVRMFINELDMIVQRLLKEKSTLAAINNKPEEDEESIPESEINSKSDWKPHSKVDRKQEWNPGPGRKPGSKVDRKQTSELNPRHESDPGPNPSRKSKHGSKHSRKSEPESKRSRTSEPKPKHSRKSEPESKRSRTSEPKPKHSRKSEVEPKHSRKSEIEPKHSRKSELEPKHGRKSELEPWRSRKAEHALKRSRKSEPEPQPRITTSDWDRARRVDVTPVHPSDPHGRDRGSRHSEKKKKPKDRYVQTFDLIVYDSTS